MREIVAGLLLALAIVVGGSFFATRTPDKAVSHPELKVATNSGWLPQSYLDDHNQLVGFDIDVSREIARRLGRTVRFETPEFSAMTGGHWHGRWDMAVGSVTPTKARSQVVDFAGTYYYSPYVFAVNRNSTAQTFDDLDGKTIGVETGTTSEDYIRRRLRIDAPDSPPVKYTVTPGEVRTYADSMLPFDDLRLGDGVRLDAVIAPEQTVLRAIKNGYPIKILPGGYAFREPLTVVTDKGNPQWTARIKGIVAAMKADGALRTLTTKWYGRDYSR
ncbi:MAG TPA: transporter substrate-binding domain-containing protein [Caulobacteraceae bacterium]|jgi:polar amino acid transport system substrate-binding protein